MYIITSHKSYEINKTLCEPLTFLGGREEMLLDSPGLRLNHFTVLGAAFKSRSTEVHKMEEPGDLSLPGPCLHSK